MTPLFRAALPYLIGATVLGACVVGVRWYGSNQYDNGYHQARVDMLAESQAATATAQQEKDLAESNYRAAVQAREASERSRDAHIDRLNRLLAQRAGNATSASAPSRTDGAGETRNVVLRECIREYSAMGEHAGRLADKVNGWQQYGAVLQRWGAK